MASKKPFFLNALTAFAACSVLVACGGERSKSSGYNDDHYTSASTITSRGDTATRLDRLEQDVETLKRDFSQLAMTYNGLMTTNDRIDALLTRLETRQTAVPVVEKTPLTKTTDKPAVKRTALPAEPTVMGVRLGEHPNKSRLVIDVSKLVPVQTDLDNNEKILLVTLSGVAWEAKKTVSGLSSPLVAGWSVQESAGTKVMAIQLKKPVKITDTQKISPEKGVAARIVIDLSVL